MSISVAELLQRLQSALDNNYNVANMDTILQVITQLESIQITKEQLEATRLGKYVNNLRRKTTNDSLARRLKNLLKKWRETVLRPPNSTTPKMSSALVQQSDERESHQQSYNQSREQAQYHETIEHISDDNSKYPVSDNRRHGRIHETGSNHASLAAKNLPMTNDQIEDCSRYTNKVHDIKSNLSTNVGRQLTMSSGKSKELDPYRMLLRNDNSKSHISISALPKIPKINRNSATSLRLSKHTDLSDSPLMNIKESSPKYSSIAHNENSMHTLDMQNFKRFPPNQSSTSNGRNQNYGDNNLTSMDNNSNSSSININEPEIIVPNVSQISVGNVNIEAVKKKHKKHKKDKKSKKQKQAQSQSPATTERFPVTTGSKLLELPDSLSSNSISLFGTTSDSIKDQHMLTNSNVFASSIGLSLPSTSINHGSKNIWTPTIKSNTVSTGDLTFTGRFTKTDNNIISVDSSSGSNSPKYRSRSPLIIPNASRSSSPSRLNMLPMKGSNYGSRVATDEENSSTQYISLLHQNESSVPSPFGGNLVQDELISNDVVKKSVSNIGQSGALEIQQTGKKRGRKKGSKGVDSRLGSASNSSHSQQTGAPYYDSISFSSLKNKIDSIRGTTKKVKTTKELLAELQNRKATMSAEVSPVESQFQSNRDGDENGFTNGKRNLGSRTMTATSPVPFSQNRIENLERNSSKKSKSAGKEGSVSDNQNSEENKTIIDSTDVKSLIDKEIEELRAKLAPVNKAALKAWEKKTYDMVVCTCKLIELTYSEQMENDNNPTTNDPSIENTNVPKMLSDCTVLPHETPNANRLHELNDNQPKNPTSNPYSYCNITLATSISTNIPRVKSVTELPETMNPPVKKPTIKSIFDLDYDDDDPITFELTHNNNINLNTKVNKISSNRDSNNDISDDKSCDELFLNKNSKRERDEIPINDTTKNDFSANIGHCKQDDDDLGLDEIQNKNIAATNTNVNLSKTLLEEPKAHNTDLNAIEPQNRFRVEEDVNCKAKQLYITSKQLITEYHIEKLHSLYIPNINGNWDETINHKNEKNSVIPENTVNCGASPLQANCCGSEEQIFESDIEAMTRNLDKQNPEKNTLDDETIIEMEPRITESSIGLYERVVPLCNHLIVDRLPKNLSHINLKFDPSDEVEPDVFIASITVKKDVISSEDSLSREYTVNAVRSNDDRSQISADDSTEAEITQNCHIYGCSDIECGGGPAPDINLSDLDRRCGSVPDDFECEPVEHLSEMDVEDIVINNDDQINVDTGNDLYSIDNDPFVAPMDSKNGNFIEGSDIESYNENETSKSPSPVIDENARAGAHDIDNLHQVIDVDPNQILPETTDENAMDSMDFENQLSKSFDMAIPIEHDECKTQREIRSDEGQSNEDTDGDLEPVELIHTTDLSESGEENHDEYNDNDASSQDDDSFENYGDDTSNDHFITLENFDTLKQSQSSNNSNSITSCDEDDEELNKETELDINSFGNMLCDDEKDDIDPTNLVVPTRFCKTVFTEAEKPINLSNGNSDSLLATNSYGSSGSYFNVSKRLEPEFSESDQPDIVTTFQKLANNAHEPQIHQKLTKGALETHEALNEIGHRQKRFRSSTSSSISSTSSTTSSTSTLSPRSKKMKRWMRRRPCPQHCRCSSTSSQSSTHSPISALSPSSIFTTSNAIELPESTKQPDFVKPNALNDFSSISNQENIKICQNINNMQIPTVEAIQEQQQLTIKPSSEEQTAATESVMEVGTSPLLNDEQMESSASITENHDDNLLFPNTLPEQLLQCDEKEDEGNNSDRGDQNRVIQKDLPKPVDGEYSHESNKAEKEPETSLSLENNEMLPSFNNLSVENLTGVSVNGYKFKEWYEVVHVKSYNDELLTILPYVVID